MDRYFLIRLAQWVTGKPRDIVRAGVDFEWTHENYVHCVFRVFELLFGRRHGVRIEMSFYADKDHKVVQYHTLEAALAGIEGHIRLFYRGLRKELIPVRVWVPQMATPSGFQLPMQSAYLFAAAFDQFTYNAGDGITSLTTSLTLSGSNLALAPAQYVGLDSNNVAGTWNTTETLSTVQQISPAEANRRWGTLVRQNATVTTANLVLTVGSSSTVRCFGSSFSGTFATGQPDASTSGTRGSAGTSWSQTITSVADNCMLVAYMRQDGTSVSSIGGGGTSIVIEQAGTGMSGAYKLCGTAGSQSLTFTYAGTSTGSETGCLMTLKPSASSGPANLKSLDGNLKANIKSIDGNLIANVKSFDGNA